MKITYNIHVPSELSAGLRGVNDTVTITVGSGDPGGITDEFAEYMRKSLEAWYDGGTVEIEEEVKKTNISLDLASKIMNGEI